MQPNFLFQQAIGSDFRERWWVNIIKKIHKGFFFNNYCFPICNSFVTYYMLAINFSGILAWKLFGEFSSTARHNYPLYLHNVKLIALTFQMQYQKPCDALNWALPCDQSSIPRGWQQCTYVLFHETCFHSSTLKHVDWLFMREKEKRKQQPESW